MTDLHAVFDGPADAQVLVLGPSLGTDNGLFDDQVDALAERYRIIRFDLPGHGGSPIAPGPCTMARMAGDVIALLDRVGVGRFHYAGVSIGGAIGLQLALDHPDRLVSLTACASAARFADPPAWPVRAATVREKGTEAMVASRPGTWFTHQFADREPDTARRLVEMLRATSAEGYAECCEAIGAFDVRDRLSEIDVPTLTLAGAEDRATPPTMLQEIADGIDGARLVTVPDTAHLLNAEAPVTVNNELAAHLSNAHSAAGHG
jgi:3-oxoadipate enol-lactonase